MGLLNNFYPVFSILLLASIYFTIIIVAGLKLIQCKLENNEKIIWIGLFIIINIVAAVTFILYHDYYIDKVKRA